MDEQLQLVHATLIDVFARQQAIEEVFLSFVKAHAGDEDAEYLEKRICQQHLHYYKQLVNHLSETMDLSPVLSRLLDRMYFELKGRSLG